MYLARPALKRYAWGSSTDLPGLLGIEPDGGPYAEAWWGAHPGGPAVVEVDGERVPLDEVIAADPVGMLGEDVVAAYDGQLPFLLKILAIAKPLSIQVHPSAEAARVGFAREEEAGIPRNAPDRVYRDDSHKPEMIVALTPLVLLSGFREAERVAEDLGRIGGPVADELATLCCSGGVPEGFVPFLKGVMANEGVPGLVADLARVGEWEGASPSLTVAANAAVHFPGDRGVLIALAMNVVRLAPGEACFTSDGIIHGHLSGVGLEIMASSDNVIRAGLTSKHIDVEGLLAVSKTMPSTPDRPEVSREGKKSVYTPVAEEYRLAVVEGGSVEFVAGPRMVLSLEGEAAVRSSTGEMTLAKGDAAFIPHSDGPAIVESVGKTAVASVR